MVAADDNRRIRTSPARSALLKLAGKRKWAAALVLFGAMASTTLAANQAAGARQITFAKDIAPLLFERCGGCHHPDGSAPFSLLTYADARRRASLIAAVTKRRLMPPWKAEPGYGDFVGQRHLTDPEIALIERWAIDGAPEGDPRDLPPPPEWTAGWQLGKPDLVVSLPEPYVVRADGPDYSRTFVMALPVGTLRYVKGFEFHPGNSRVVHHANIQIDRTPASRRLDEADPAPGYEGLLPLSAAYPDGHFLGWTPGQAAPILPKGLAWRLNPGTDLVVEMHFVPSGKAEVVQPAVGLFFGDEPPARTPAMLRLGRQDIDIPAGQKEYVTTDFFVLPVDVEVQAVQPHAHYRAREIRATATLPDGTTKPLIYIKDWDYRWQHVYRYVVPLLLPRGTTLAMRVTYDNSADNPRNPHQPPRRVSWGQRSTEEMGDIWIQMLTRTDRDLRELNEQIRPKHIREQIVGYETMLRTDPSTGSLHNDLAMLYQDIGQPEKAIAHFESVAKLKPESAAAYYNLGTALLEAGRPHDAIDQFGRALRLKPDYTLAHNNLGHALEQLASPEEALRHFREAARLDPDDADAYYNIGTLFSSRGEMATAIGPFRQAVRLQPDWVRALASLSWALATVPSRSRADVDEAVHLAAHAATLTDGRNALVLNVLAAAQAAAGRFDLAVTTCAAALALNPEAPLAAAIRQRQALYKQQQR
jgi:tetratricopeptide (TPR) repeat protein/mono/diheme cytochrome c family protein